MTRRKFASSLVVMLALISTACPIFSNIYKSMTQYIPLALLAFDRIIAILIEHNIVVTGLVDAIDAAKAALADILSAVREFEDAHGNEKPTKIEAIRTALKIAHTRLELFWDRLQIPNQQLAITVKALLSIILSTLAGFEAQLRPGDTSRGKTIFAVPKARSIREFREDFNAVLREHDEIQFAI